MSKVVNKLKKKKVQWGRSGEATGRIILLCLGLGFKERKWGKAKISASPSKSLSPRFWSWWLRLSHRVARQVERIEGGKNSTVPGTLKTLKSLLLLLPSRWRMDKAEVVLGERFPACLTLWKFLWWISWASLIISYSSSLSSEKKRKKEDAHTAMPTKSISYPDSLVAKRWRAATGPGMCHPQWRSDGQGLIASPQLLQGDLVLSLCWWGNWGSERAKLLIPLPQFTHGCAWLSQDSAFFILPAYQDFRGSLLLAFCSFLAVSHQSSFLYFSFSLYCCGNCTFSPFFVLAVSSFPPSGDGPPFPSAV